MTAPVHRIIEGLRQIERRFQPAALVRAKVVARENEARFLLEMVADAASMLEEFERGGGSS